MPHPAPPHGKYITSAICAVYNALDFPACVVPFGRVDLTKDVTSEEWYSQEPYPDMPNFLYDRYDKDMKELYKYCCSEGSQVSADEVYPYTDPEVFENVPLRLQIVTLPY
jgi:amidase